MKYQITLDDREIIVEATFQPGYAGDRECPPEDDCFEIADIWEADGVTPVELDDDDMERLQWAIMQECYEQADIELHETLED